MAQGSETYTLHVHNPEPHIQTSSYFLCTLPIAMAQSFQFLDDAWFWFLHASVDSRGRGTTPFKLALSPESLNCLQQTVKNSLIIWVFQLALHTTMAQIHNYCSLLCTGLQTSEQWTMPAAWVDLWWTERPVAVTQPGSTACSTVPPPSRGSTAHMSTVQLLFMNWKLTNHTILTRLHGHWVYFVHSKIIHGKKVTV